MDAEYFHKIRKQLDKEYGGITGVGYGYKKVGGIATDRPSIIIYVEEKLPLGELSFNDVLPAAINNMPTDVIEMRMPYALQLPTERHRPVPGGVSIGHYSITAGTMGSAVRDRGTGIPLFLSNNHVLAASNAGIVGDAILQPGAADGGTQENDTVAVLERFIPILFQTPDIPPIEPPDCQLASLTASTLSALARLLGSRHRLLAYKAQENGDDGPKLNKVDCAVARPIRLSDVSFDILNIGTVAGVHDPEIGLEVQKSGRTTEYKRGIVEAINVSLSVSYGGLRVATFIGQAIVTSDEQFSAPGDSGSLVLDMDNQAVGLLFAGGEASTIINPIGEVVSALDIVF